MDFAQVLATKYSLLPIKIRQIALEQPGIHVLASTLFIFESQ
jgi:hypothetical protein